MRGQPQVGFRRFMSTTAAMRSGAGPLGAGFLRTVGENNRRYFRFVNARWSLNSVEGFKTIAERIKRLGRIKSAHTPTTTRSEQRRLGERCRDRFRISSWCLISTDSVDHG